MSFGSIDDFCEPSKKAAVIDAIALEVGVSSSAVSITQAGGPVAVCSPAPPSSPPSAPAPPAPPAPPYPPPGTLEFGVEVGSAGRRKLSFDGDGLNQTIHNYLDGLNQTVRGELNQTIHNDLDGLNRTVRLFVRDFLSEYLAQYSQELVSINTTATGAITAVKGDCAAIKAQLWPHITVLLNALEANYGSAFISLPAECTSPPPPPARPPFPPLPPVVPWDASTQRWYNVTIRCASAPPTRMCHSAHC